MKKALALLLAVVLILLVGCQSGGETKTAGTDSLLKPPVVGTEWGMTLEEVQAVLDEAGAAPIESNSAHGVWLAITHEDTGKVGMETVAELALSESSLQPITLHFMVDLDGTARLSLVTVEIVVPSEEDRLPLTTAKEELTAWLTKTYGEPVPGTTARWGITGTKITEEQAQNLTMAERGLLESDGYDCLNIYPQLNYAMGGSLTNLEATLMYFAGSYVHLLYGNYQ
ncbi:MAG: hypothetical protein IKU17_04815 [Clostridia bacterium]|nr:hypothetical protein [Clostridia bacterium]